MQDGVEENPLEEVVKAEEQEHQLSAIVDMDQVQKEAENEDNEEIPDQIQNDDAQMVIEAEEEEP